MKLAPEGYPFVLGFLAVTILVAFFVLWAAVLPFVLTMFMVYFFRDPERSAPGGENVFVSPADGKIILIQNIHEERFLNADTLEVSIFMSPLDVHVNRAPCDGTVESVVHTPGKFFSAFKHEASMENENIAMVLNTKYGKVLVRQVAGFLARRAVCRVSPGDVIKKGERYGIIKFSSRVDLHLPKNTKSRIKLGDRVKAGETVLAEI